MMNENDYKAIRQIIADLEKISETADSFDSNIDEIVQEVEELKDSIDERYDNVADYELANTSQNLEKQDASAALDEIITGLEELKENLNNIQNAIVTLNNL